MNYIFIHGGPGLNSRPESQLFAPFIGSNDFYYWSEPSAQRKDEFNPAEAYGLSLMSLKAFILKHSSYSPVTIVAHSFGSFLLNDLLPELGDRIRELILLCPVFDLSRLDQNIADLGLRTLSQRGDKDAWENYQALQLNMSEAFDERRFLTLVGALSMPEVLPAYWHNQERAAAYNECLKEEGWQIDFSSFKAVRETTPHDRVKNMFRGPTTVIYGRQDPVARLEQDEVAMKFYYPKAQLHILEASGHYPHIEETSEFFKILK